MYKLAIYIQKGGVGKTVTSGNIAYDLSQHKKVCLIDACFQGNSSYWFLTDPVKFEFADVLFGNAGIKDSLMKVNNNFYILPTVGSERLLYEYNTNKINSEPYSILNLIEKMSEFDFDYLIFDCGPGLNTLNFQIISQVDEIITPLDPEVFGLDGFQMFLQHFEYIKKTYRCNPIHKKIILNRLNKSIRRHREVLNALQESNYDLFTIPQCQGIADSIGNHLPVFMYDPQCKSVPEFNKITQSILS